MMKAADPVGPANYDHLAWICERASKNGGITICAWGAKGSHRNQERTFLAWTDRWSIEPMALRLTSKGKPEHPLYIPYDVPPVATRIVNEVNVINRICYDISSKPPGKIEWE